MTTVDKKRTLAVAPQARISRRHQRAEIVPVALAIVFLVGTVATQQAQAQTLTTLHSFNGTDGTDPLAGLVQASDGNLYGTTGNGGAQGAGTVFKITAGGTLTTLYTFCAQSNCTDGGNPFARLVQATDGNLYGTTGGGGAVNDGTVFKITLSGALTTLYSFCAQSNCTDGYQPQAGLVQGTDGNLYGTTPFGGIGGGTVFKITPGGALTTLYSFCSASNCADGIRPVAGLIQATDGNFYGTTVGGGAVNDGTVFKITLGGTLTTIYSFCAQTNCTDGAAPYAGLVQATDGNLYGTTVMDGANGYGTVFRITPSGALTTLYAFCSQSSCTDGGQPWAALVQATDGNFYGMTPMGGIGSGTVFNITPSGVLTTLYTFCSASNCTDGGSAYVGSGLVQATDGNFYGTTEVGGDIGYGTVFRLSVVSSPSVTLSPTSLGFGNQPVTITSGASSITLTNSGNADLTIGSVVLSGTNAADFSVTTDTCSGETVAPNTTCSVGVTFTPGVPGSKTASLDFPDNAGGSPQRAALSGIGTDFSLSASPTAQTVKAGKSAKYTVSVAPISGFTGGVALSCSGAPPAGTCTVLPTSVTLNGTNASSATVTATTSPGKKGTPKSTYTLTLRGSFGTLGHSTTVTLTVH